MSMNGEYLTLADACGEGRREGSNGWVAGIDFDPYDEDEMDTMRLVWARERADTMDRLLRENDRLRRLLGEKEGY